MANGYYDTIMATSGLVGYWRLGETTSTMAPSSGAVSGTVFNSPTRGVAGATVDDINLAVTLNGTTQYIGFGNNYANASSYSVECWVKFTSVAATSGFQTFVSKEDYGTTPASGWGLYLEEATNTISFVRMDTTSVKKMNAGSFTSGVWYHIVATYDGSNLRLYSNGVQIGTAVASAIGAKTSTAPMRIGQAGTGGDFFGGTIDELAIYNVALSGATILAHYQAASITATFLSRSDSGTIVGTEANGGIVAIMTSGETTTILSSNSNTISSTLARSDAGTITNTVSRSILGVLTRTDGGTITNTMVNNGILSTLTRTDGGTILHSITKDIVTGNPTPRNIENADDIRRRQDAIDREITKYVGLPYTVMFEHQGVFNDAEPAYDDFIVVDEFYNPVLVGQSVTDWVSGSVSITISRNVETKAYLLQKFGIKTTDIG